jgi:hypothetical protein
MGWAITFGVVVVALAAIAYVHAFGKMTPPSYRTFTVSAEGKAVAVPDVAQFTFSVITEGADLAKLQKDNTDKTNKVSAFIKDKGIDDKDVSTIDYQVTPRYQYYPCTGIGPCRQPSIDGYTVTQTTRVKVRDFSKTGDLLSGVVAQGANSVSQLSFTQDDPEKALNEARADAVAKARSQAEMIAAAGEFGVGDLVSVSENGTGGPMPYYGYGGDMKMTFDSAQAAPAAPTIQPGSQDVTVSLMLTYEIR